jgi:ribosome-binding protein aMBF1 (putative translation factor)
MGMQLTVRVPDEYGEKIAVLAEMMGLKKSDIARLAMKQFIDENLNRILDSVIGITLVKKFERAPDACNHEYRALGRLG